MDKSKFVEAGSPTMSDKEIESTSVRPRDQDSDISEYDQARIEKVYK